ncbi:MAG: CCA tRNA nucleotidyltransferase [Candidatus Aenigmatarchaeota archaeon]
MTSVLKHILKRIKPSSHEERKLTGFIGDLLETAARITKHECMPCGSFGKNTWLSGDHDIDLFVLFPTNAPRENLEKEGLNIGKKIVAKLKGRIQIKYAEHPYVRGFVKGYVIDIVPCYKIKKGEKIKSAVDRSPFHLEYVIQNLADDMANEVRLLKQFCKGIGVYGSDTRNMGFSGYICELLVIKYKSFSAVMQNAAKWQAPQVITVDKTQEKMADTKKFSQPLIIIDPTDTGRNAAANISAENFVKFSQKARKFLSLPAESFFFPQPDKPLSASEQKLLASRGTCFFAMIMKKPDIIDDTLYPQMRKAMNRIESMLKNNEFIILRKYEYTGKTMIFFFELEIAALPHIKRMVGPSVFSRVHSNEFLSKYEKSKDTFRVFVENSNWIAEIKRRFISTTPLLQSLTKKSMNELIEAGIPENLVAYVKSAKIIDTGFWGFVRKNSHFSSFLRKKYYK